MKRFTTVDEFDFQPGDTLLTRNEKDNSTPGYWNHCAIYVGDERVVEAQVEPYNRVMYSHIGEFIERYPVIRVLRHSSTNMAVAVATNAILSVDKSYWGIASIFRRLRALKRGENCVSVVRRAWSLALNNDPRWHRPDHLLEFKGFEIVAEKEANY